MNIEIQNSNSEGYPNVHCLPDFRPVLIQKNSGLFIFAGGAGIRSERGIGRPLTGAKRYFEFYAISHMYAGKGSCVFQDGEPVELHEGDCILVAPHMVHFYGALPGSYFCEDTVNFTGPLADLLYRSGLFFNGIFPLGGVRKLLPVLDLINDPSEYAQLNAVLELQKLLYEIYNSRFKKLCAGRDSKIEELLKRLRAEPERWWTVSSMAEFCNMSDDQLRRVFLQRTGTLPKVYADKIKLIHSAQLLRKTNLPVSEISRRSGYADPFHFSRRFKALIGYSPAEYRREIRLGKIQENE